MGNWIALMYGHQNRPLVLPLSFPRLNENITKHLEDGIWELRPGNNRVFYFFYENNTFVLLHQFRKKSQKTPKREIEKAKSERNDYLSRKEHDKS